ncbi:MAG: hypothetical protein IT423_06515 [Pirellulaceae bacterium]|nr:hypothetical protein [Pirellulaceae bacterium]
MIAKPLAAALGLPAIVPGEIAAGVEYHLDGAALTPKRVRQLKESIDQSNLSTEQEQQLVMGATGFMELLIDLYVALSPTTGSAVPSPLTCPMQGTSTRTAPRTLQALPVGNAAPDIAGKSGTPVVNNAVHATDGDVGSIVRTDRQLKSA